MVSFETALLDSQTLVERRLAMLLARERIPGRLGDAMRHGVLGGGKRFRPFLVIETARLFDGDAAQALDVAAALECVHCYSLVHDDLPVMDNDALRRGQPTVWKAFDEWTAVLAGDALLTQAFAIIADAAGAAEARLRLTSELAAASGAGGMVGGQTLDLEADKLGLPAVPDRAHIERLQSLKTGALIRFGAMAGPIIAGRDRRDVERLARFGELLGLAFQISDDLIDAAGDEQAAGKAVGKDAAAGKQTLVGLMGLDAARAQLARLDAEAREVLAPYGARAAVLSEAMRFMQKRTA